MVNNNINKVKEMDQIELDRLNKELEELKVEMKYYYNHGHNNEEVNSRYKQILSKIYNIKPNNY